MMFKFKTPPPVSGCSEITSVWNSSRPLQLSKTNGSIISVILFACVYILLMATVMNIIYMCKINTKPLPDICENVKFG